MINRKQCRLFIISAVFCMVSGTFFNKAFGETLLSYKRIWGKTRYETSAEICQSTWKTSQFAVIASGENYPDALCAAPLAKKLNAPILLTGYQDLNVNAEQEIQRIGAKEVYIVGGTGVISENVKKRLNQLGIKTIRLGGADRYETSVKIAETITPENSKAAIASGEGFADALSIASIAAQQKMPILLSKNNEIPKEVQKYLKDKEISLVYIIGGNGIISQNAVNVLSDYQIDTKRLYGSDRYQTNIAVLNEFSSILNFKKVYVTSGNDFADALCGSAIATDNLYPTILSGKIIDENTLDFVSEMVDKSAEVIILGGTGAVTNNNLSVILNKIGLYSLCNEKQYEIDEVITITNNGENSVKNFKGVLNLGTLNDSSYQNNELLYVYGSGIKLIKDAEGKYTAIIDLSYIESGQTVQYTAVRKFTNAGIKYNVHLENTSGDYSDFLSYAKYTSPESKIESDNALIKSKALEIVKGETNPYLKAKKIFEFVNTYMSYDETEHNKGAFNALITAKGVCEDYADLFVAMARTVGIPSRVVYGYWEKTENLSKEQKDISGEGHAWVEFYLPEYGWIVCEPTIDYTVNGIKTAAINYFANLDDGGHFVKTYEGNDGFRSQYEGLSPKLSIDDTQYIKITSD